MIECFETFKLPLHVLEEPRRRARGAVFKVLGPVTTFFLVKGWGGVGVKFGCSLFVAVLIELSDY